VTGLSAGALTRLKGHAWPGNVRELAHTVEKLVLLGRAAEIGVEDLRDLLDHGAEAPGRFEFHGDIIPLRDLERRYASWALAKTGGHRAKTAEKLGVDPKTLRKWLGDSEREGDE
jgi:two-component system response regulator HydG